jgi:hypothetical protein
MEAARPPERWFLTIKQHSATTQKAMTLFLRREKFEQHFYHHHEFHKIELYAA